MGDDGVLEECGHQRRVAGLFQHMVGEASEIGGRSGGHDDAVADTR